MTYDATAQKLAVKTIGTVESSMDWGAINGYDPATGTMSPSADPITVGIAQWFGTRAAGILQRMQAAPGWTSVAPSINNDLATIPANDTYWTTRYLTGPEASSLVSPLNANQVIQSSQLAADLDAYKAHAASTGKLDPDADTDAMIMFFTAYHQSPAEADIVIGGIAAHPTLAAMRDAILADSVFSAYPSRYNTAYSIISAHDTTGVPDFGSAPPAPAPVTGGAGSSVTPSKGIQYVQHVGDLVAVKMDTGTVMCSPNGRGWFLPNTGSAAATAPPPGTPPVPGSSGAWVNPNPTGVLTSGYGPRDPSIGRASFHWGIDLSTPGYAGTIYAPADGVIKVATDNGNVTAGTYAKMWTDDGAYTLNFYHMQYGSLQVTPGQHVTAGTPIGTEGATGNVTGRHLHFEVYDGQYADPWPGYPVNPIDPLPVLAAHGVVIS